ncbi:hypothetical protein HYC85_023693 [Camellia sinensis]|uniref:DUF4220 domain-containing protein n=1 Tax=Camellia sinensis TaxID=4442 RepID=A0A7J7GJ20_CAMSI|nr:hypothetical protein HYC85_023693 [Camellia sinensis]
MLFYLTALNLACFLREEAPILKEDETDRQVVAAVNAWKHADFLCRNYVLNGLDNTLYNVYSPIKTAKELWESLEKKIEEDNRNSEKRADKHPMESKRDIGPKIAVAKAKAKAKEEQQYLKDTVMQIGYRILETRSPPVVCEDHCILGDRRHSTEKVILTVTPLEDLDVVVHAYDFFQTCKGFLVDLRFSSGQRDESRTFFLRRTARDAFKVVEAELNFIYEILYTKVRVLQGKYGYLLRFVSFILIVVALVLFCLIDKHKQGFHKFDVGITFTLLLGAIALDIIAFLMLLLSDRTAVALTNSDDRSIVVRMLKKSLNFNRKRWPEDSPTQHCTCSFGWFMQIMRRRWPESIPQYNYIDYCLHPRLQIWEKLIGFFGLTNMLDGLQYAKTVEFTNDLRELVFEELKMKSKMAYNLESAKEIYLARGDWVLRHEDCTDLLPWIIEVDFDESLHLWHIATDLCFHSCNVSMDANTEDGDSKNKDFRGLSKLLSDYMAYLLNMESTIITPVEDIGKIRFKDTSDQVLDTLAEAKTFFHERIIGKIIGRSWVLVVS